MAFRLYIDDVLYKYRVSRDKVCLEDVANVMGRVCVWLEQKCAVFV